MSVDVTPVSGVTTPKSLFISLTQEELIRYALCACTKPWALSKNGVSYVKDIVIYDITVEVVYKYGKIVTFYPK